jgi:hypothetical protein
MRRLLFRAGRFVAITASLVAVTAVAHDCMHDNLDLMNEQVRLVEKPIVEQTYAHAANHNPGATLFSAQDAQPIRIAVSDEGLRRTGAFCAADGDQVPSFRTVGEKVPCGWFHVLDDGIRDRITQQILAPAIARFSQLVKVERVQGNLRVPSTDTCAETPIPESHVSNGVVDADLVLYITAAPNPDFTSVWSGACRRDQNLRAVVGRMNFDPSVVRVDGSEAQMIEDVVHELLHILGVSSIEMFRDNHKTTVNKRGKDVAVVQTPRVKSFARAYTGCQTLEGAEVEDEGQGATLSRGSHWERKVWFEEALTTMGGTKVSGLSLAFLADINVGYTVNTDGGESMIFGKGDGCGIHSNKCNTVEGGKDRYFCFEDPNNGGKTNQCSWDLKSVGFCAVDVWPDEFPPLYRYFTDTRRGGPKYMDGCPYVIAYANRQCWIPATETDDDLLYPYMFEANSRCWDGVGVAKDGFSPYFEVGSRCLESRCTSDGRVQFKAPDASQWVTCGAQSTTSEMNGGYHGDIVCPAAFDMCRSLGAPAAVITPPPATTSTPVTTTAAPQTTTQVPATTTAVPSPSTNGPSGPTASPSTSTSAPTSGAPQQTPTTTTAPGGTTTAAPGGTTTAAPGGATTAAPGGATTAAPRGTTTAAPNMPPAKQPTMPPTTAVPKASEPAPTRTASTAAPSSTTQAPGTLSPGATRSPDEGNGTATTTVTTSQTTPTPAPTSSASFTANIVVQGSFFARIMADANAWTLLREAVRNDIASLLGVAPERVSIDSMVPGSLIVNFTVSSEGPGEAASALARFQALASGTAPLPRTTAEYRKVSPSSGNLTIAESTTMDADFGSVSGAATSSITLLVIALSVVAVTALAGFVAA